MHTPRTYLFSPLGLGSRASFEDVAEIERHRGSHKIAAMMETHHTSKHLNLLIENFDGRSSGEINVEEMLANLRGIHRSKEKARLISLETQAAIEVLDSLQVWLDSNPHHDNRQRALKALVDIATWTNELPSRLFIRGVQVHSNYPANFGAYADVFKGTYLGQTIAVKRLRINESGKAKNDIHRKFCKEGLMWRQLLHPNILPFLGVDAQTFAENDLFGMVSPWMQRGTLMQHLSSSEYDAHKHREQLIIGVARGLRYLHKQHLAHGDLHGSNIFITDDGQPCLADFGLTVIGDITVSRTVTNQEAVGAMRWIAPELFADDKPSVLKTPAADVFSFGRVCLAICTGRHPFHETHDKAVMLRVANGENPPHPTDNDCGGIPMSENLWVIINQCWMKDPTDRPNMEKILSALKTPSSDSTLLTGSSTSLGVELNHQHTTATPRLVPDGLISLSSLFSAVPPSLTPPGGHARDIRPTQSPTPSSGPIVLTKKAKPGMPISSIPWPPSSPPPLLFSPVPRVGKLQRSRAKNSTGLPDLVPKRSTTSVPVTSRTPRLKIPPHPTIPPPSPFAAPQLPFRRTSFLVPRRPPSENSARSSRPSSSMPYPRNNKDIVRLLASTAGIEATLKYVKETRRFDGE